MKLQTPLSTVMSLLTGGAMRSMESSSIGVFIPSQLGGIRGPMRVTRNGEILAPLPCWRNGLQTNSCLQLGTGSGR